MGKAARIKRQRTGPFEHDPKRPTGKYKTAKERQAERSRDRRIAQRQERLVAQVAASALQEGGQR